MLAVQCTPLCRARAGCSTWIEYGNSGGNKLAGIARDNNEVFQRGNGGNEQVWLTKGVVALLSFDRHRFPANDDVLGNREHAPEKKRSQGPIEPHVNIRATACIFKLFDPEPDFTECDFGGKKHLTRLCGDELSNSRIWSRLAKIGNDVRIEKPTRLARGLCRDAAYAGGAQGADQQDGPQ